MNKNLVTITGDSTIIDACKRFYRHKIGRLIVLDEGQLKGIITERDIISKIVILNENAELEDAIKLIRMLDTKYP